MPSAGSGVLWHSAKLVAGLFLMLSLIENNQTGEGKGDLEKPRYLLNCWTLCLLLLLIDRGEV